jgi:hypothetical protein
VAGWEAAVSGIATRASIPIAPDGRTRSTSALARVEASDPSTAETPTTAAEASRRTSGPGCTTASAAASRGPFTGHAESSTSSDVSHGARRADTADRVSSASSSGGDPQPVQQRSKTAAFDRDDPQGVGARAVEQAHGRPVLARQDAPHGVVA